MSKDPDETIRRVAQEAAPQASVLVLRRYVGREDLAIPELLMAALKLLSVSGRIRRQSDKTAVNAVSWLLDQVPDANPLKAEILQIYQHITSRSS
jgi:hypothetical protein